MGGRLNQAYTALQIKAMQRAAEPIQIVFSMDTLGDVMKLNHDLVDLAFARKLDTHTLSAINGVVQNQLRVLLPEPPSSPSPLESIVKWAMSIFEDLPLEQRNKAIASLRSRYVQAADRTP